ncbi:MAG: OmpA family protein, partial [Granulosicoccus sp.]
SREIPSTQDLSRNRDLTTASAGLAFADSDADGVMNAEDRCPASTRGFPVNVAGCGVFFGELDGVEFSDDNREIVGDTTQSLDAYARLLQRFPQSRIEIVAHTDDSGTQAEQSLRTRTRLRALGLYLVDKGVSKDQLILRSFGGNRPRNDNSTEAGRKANNRIEIFERPRP